MKSKWLNLCQRIYDLIIKFISVKGVVFVIATFLMAGEKIHPYAWGFFAAVLIGVRTVEKWIGASVNKQIDKDDGK